MGAPRRARKIDTNQRIIVRGLRQIPRLTVAVDHDDILVGYKGFTYWFEIKSQDVVSKKTGEILQSAIQPSQQKLKETWQGHYSIVYSLEQILEELGIV